MLDFSYLQKLRHMLIFITPLGSQTSLEDGYLGVPTALRRVIMVGIYTEPHFGISTSGTKTVAGMTMQ